MASNIKNLLLPLALLAGATALTTVMYLNRPPSAITEPSYVPVTIDVAEAVMEDIRIPIQAQGTVTPLRRTTLVSEVTGNIVEVSPAFNVGGYISKGETLLRIDPRNYQTALLRAQAAVASAQSNLAQEKGRVKVAQEEWKRLPSGSQRSNQARDLYLRKPQLEQAEAQMLAAQADLNTARDNLERTIITAPYDALIRAKDSELGQFVSMGSPLASVVAVDYAEVRLAVPQSKLAYIDIPELTAKAGPPVQIDLYTDVGGEVKHWPAQLHRTEGVYDERSRVLYTVARIADPYALADEQRQPLRIGTFVNANIQGRLLSDLVVLPRYIVRAGNHVWVVDADQILRNRKLTVLRTGGDQVYVSAGLASGDLVSLTALDNTFAGARVEIVSRTPTDALRGEEESAETHMGAHASSKEPAAENEPTREAKAQEGRPEATNEAADISGDHLADAGMGDL